MLYKKRVETVEAFQLTEERRRDNRDWPEWLNNAWNKDKSEVGSMFVYPNKVSDIAVRTASREISVIRYGDYLLLGPLGNIRIMNEDYFESMYEPL